MLQTIKDCINDNSIEPFEIYYQSFVIHSQDSIIDRSLCNTKYKLSESIESTNSMLEGINMLTEELKII